MAGGVKRYSGHDGSNGPTARVEIRRRVTPANDNARRSSHRSPTRLAASAAIIGLAAFLAAALIWTL